MRTLLRSCGLFLATMVAALLASAPALACSCALLSVEEYVEYADVVARVVVEGIELPEGEPYSSNDPATYTLRPTHLWKGDVSGVFTVFSAVSGASCGLEGIAKGDDIVVFAYSGSDGSLPEDLDGLKANLCGGTAPADTALLSGVTSALGEGQVMEVESDAESETAGTASVAPWWGLAAVGVVLLVGAFWFAARLRRRQA